MGELKEDHERQYKSPAMDSLYHEHDDIFHQIVSKAQQVKGKYINQFMGLKCAPDLLARDLFPNAKEITESLAAFHAVKKNFQRDDGFWKKDNKVYVVGDGETPRTASLFSFRSDWQVTSIDPNLNLEKDYNIDGLHLSKRTIQDYLKTMTLGTEVNKVYVVAVHSHVGLDEFIESLSARMDTGINVVAMPCCYQQTIQGEEPDDQYRDESIWSPKNIIKVWSDV
jgi:hypothetical protein